MFDYKNVFYRLNISIESRVLWRYAEAWNADFIHQHSSDLQREKSIYQMDFNEVGRRAACFTFVRNGVFPD